MSGVSGHGIVQAGECFYLPDERPQGISGLYEFCPELRESVLWVRYVVARPPGGGAVGWGNPLRVQATGFGVVSDEPDADGEGFCMFADDPVRHYADVQAALSADIASRLNVAAIQVGRSQRYEAVWA